ncbi:MAG: hypothetical protein JWP89_3803 [Schlesneria sp.]|nr:hypothetical protein [Schlesneria sp.]
MHSHCRSIFVGLFLLIACGASSTCFAVDDSLSLYFDQLRQRGLFSIGESYAIARLSQVNLSQSRRVELTIELSRTIARHAEFVSEEQQEELWKRARSIVDDERNREPTGPYALMLAAQAGLVLASETEWLRVECELRPFDDAFSKRTRQQCADAIQLLSTLESELLGPQRDKKNVADSPSSHVLRVALYRVRLALARCLRNRAELTPADSRQRTDDLVFAETTARKLVNVSDEQIPFYAKVLLVDCARLKGDLSRAEEMLNALEKSITDSDREFLEIVTAEHARVLLDRHQAHNALELIVQLRSQNQRLSGELWFLQIRCLLSMRDMAVARKNADLAKSLRDQAEVTLQRCDDQVGGYWSRRCHQLWDATRTAEKYGPELDAVMQQARADFLGGRIDLALKGYARAEASARAATQTDLAADLGYTRASILLNDKQYEAACTEFLRLASDYAQSARAASSSLNAAYCLGRLYDQEKTQERRERYTQALDHQIEIFPSDPTADDARFFRAQLEEQRLQASVALPIYLKVASTHPRADEAHAGAARCYETVLTRMRERKLPSAEFERTALSTLEQFVTSIQKSSQTWTAPQGEVVLHLAAIQLLVEPPQFDRAESLLNQLVRIAKDINKEDEQYERWTRLRQRAESLLVVALAGNGKPLEAERLLDSLAAAAPRDLLVIVERLAPFVASPNRQRQLQYGELQLRAVELLSKHRSSLARDEQDRLDQSLGRTYLASGQITKAIEIYERQATAAAKDANRQREIAVLLSEFEPREAAVLAKQCWRRVESLSKQGSPEWLTARLGVITTCIKLNELAEARKLLALAKVLYPELGGGELKVRYEAEERRLGMAPAK